MSLRNISLSVYVFFVGLLVFSLASIMFFKQNQNHNKDIGTNIPSIEIRDFTFYLLKLQELGLMAEGGTLLRFNTHDEAYELFTHQLDSQKNKSEIYTPFVNAKRDMYYFPQNVQFIREDGLFLWSKEGVYDYKKRLFKGQGEFFLSKGDTDLKGFDVVFNQSTDFVSGIKLSGVIELRDSQAQ